MSVFSPRPKPHPADRANPRVRASLLVLLFALGLCGCDSDRGVSHQGPPEDAGTESSDHDTSSDRTRVSESGAYRVEIRPEDAAAARDSIHPWLVRVTTLHGEPIRPTRLAFSGGMPQHGHGFPTAPYVTDALEDGWFRVGGVRFHMAGAWSIRVEFVGPGGPDIAVFEISIAP